MEGNLTKSTFLEVYDKYSSSMTEMARLKSAHSGLCKQIKEIGIDLNELKLAYKQSSHDPAEILLHEEARRRYRLWLNRPVGFQPSLIEDEEPADTPEDEAAVVAHGLQVAYETGVGDGRAGMVLALRCPYPVRTEEHQQYTLGYEVGKQMRNGEMPPTHANGGEGVPLKRRGRPPGSKNKPPSVEAIVAEEFSTEEVSQEPFN